MVFFCIPLSPPPPPPPDFTCLVESAWNGNKNVPHPPLWTSMLSLQGKKERMGEGLGSKRLLFPFPFLPFPHPTPLNPFTASQVKCPHRPTSDRFHWPSNAKQVQPRKKKHIETQTEYQKERREAKFKKKIRKACPQSWFLLVLWLLICFPSRVFHDRILLLFFLPLPSLHTLPSKNNYLRESRKERKL